MEKQLLKASETHCSTRRSSSHLDRGASEMISSIFWILWCGEDVTADVDDEISPPTSCMSILLKGFWDDTNTHDVLTLNINYNELHISTVSLVTDSRWIWGVQVCWWAGCFSVCSPLEPEDRCSSSPDEQIHRWTDLTRAVWFIKTNNSTWTTQTRSLSR